MNKKVYRIILVRKDCQCWYYCL